MKNLIHSENRAIMNCKVITISCNDGILKPLLCVFYSRSYIKYRPATADVLIDNPEGLGATPQHELRNV